MFESVLRKESRWQEPSDWLRESFCPDDSQLPSLPPAYTVESGLGSSAAEVYQGRGLVRIKRAIDLDRVAGLKKLATQIFFLASGDWYSAGACQQESSLIYPIVRCSAEKKLWSFASSDEMVGLFSECLGQPVTIHLCTVCRMGKGGFAVPHVHNLRNTRTLCSALLYLNVAKAGGRHIVTLDSGRAVIDAEPGDLLIERSDLEHAVSRVDEITQPGMFSFLDREDNHYRYVIAWFLVGRQPG